MIRTSPLASLVLLFSLSLACGDDAGGEGGESGTGTDTADTGTSDEVGDSGSTTSSTTSTDETTTTTTTSTDEGSCPVGAEGCPCTGGGGCDPGLMCEGGVCTLPAGESSETSTTDATTTTDTTTTDTGEPMPYQACPNGDGDCAPGEVCVMGAAMMGQVPWTMCTSGECNGDNDCTVDDNDSCNDLPGDGEPIDYCVPFVCSDNNPCPDPMVCVAGFGGGTSVCVWPL